MGLYGVKTILLPKNIIAVVVPDVGMKRSGGNHHRVVTLLPLVNPLIGSARDYGQSDAPTSPQGLHCQITDLNCFLSQKLSNNLSAVNA
jgi:hypothetical protein